MTLTAAITSQPGDHIRAGLEFGAGAFACFLTLLAALLLGAVLFLASFVGALVHSAQHLHRAGHLRHPASAVTIPIVALFLAYLTISRSTLASTLLAVAGVAFGYTIMWRSGRGWFRWTAVPLLCLTLALVATR